MINHRQRLFSLLVVAVTAGGSVAQAQTSSAGSPAAPTAPAPTPTTTPTTTGAAPGTPDAPAPTSLTPPPDEVPPGEAIGGVDDSAVRSNVELPAAEHTTHTGAPLVFPSAGVTRQRRVKPLRNSISIEPTAPDFGGEADLISVLNEGTANVKPKRWTFTMHGYFRAPLRVGIGEGSIPFAATPDYVPPTNQLHSPAAHVLGIDNENDWMSVGLNPGTTGSLNMTAGNALISGTIIVSAQTFYDVGYKKLKDMGTISQAYLTMRFNDFFGSRGGLAVNAGAFSNRYGLAGPRGQSSGYYNTYLFGRTHVAGLNVTADLDLTDRAELLIEGGIGAKTEVIPWYPTPAGPAPYLPEQGPTPQGSNFVAQLHTALYFDEMLKVGAHWLRSWSPNDNWASMSGGATHPGDNTKLDVFGGDVHLDHDRFGHGYVGYSRIDATAVLSLADGVQLLHSGNGYGLVKNFLNPGYMPDTTVPIMPGQPGMVGDNGTVDTVLFQYILRMAPLLQMPATGHDLSLAVFGMFNHVKAAVTQDKFKFGAEAQYAFVKWLSAGVRFDRVMSDGGNADLAYSAVSPRLVFHTSWLSREYFLLSYTRYMIGSALDVRRPDTIVTGGPQYSLDKNLVVLSANVAF